MPASSMNDYPDGRRRSAAARPPSLRWARGRGAAQERHEARLREVRILGQGLADAELLHHDKAETVRERPVVVSMLQDKGCSGGESLGVGPCDSTGRRMQGGLQERL